MAWKCPLQSFVLHDLLIERHEVFLGLEACAKFIQLALSPRQLELAERFGELGPCLLGIEPDVFSIPMGAQHDLKARMPLDAVEEHAKRGLVLQLAAGVAQRQQRARFGPVRGQGARVDVLDQRQVLEQAEEQRPFRVIRRGVARGARGAGRLKRGRCGWPSIRSMSPSDMRASWATSLMICKRSAGAVIFSMCALAIETSRARPSALPRSVSARSWASRNWDSVSRPAHPGLEGLPAMLADVGVRVLAVGQEEEADRLVVRRERQANFQRPPGRLAAGGIAVEAEHQLVGKAQQLETCTGVVAVPSVATA